MLTTPFHRALYDEGPKRKAEYPMTTVLNLLMFPVEDTSAKYHTLYTQTRFLPCIGLDVVDRNIDLFNHDLLSTC